MGISLTDAQSKATAFDINFWHWRAIVEAVRTLDVLPGDKVDALHEQYVGELTRDEARAVAAALRQRLLPTLAAGERLLLNGRRTMVPDDGTFHREPQEQHKNYGTSREVLERFAQACETCEGFVVT